MPSWNGSITILQSVTKLPEVGPNTTIYGAVAADTSSHADRTERNSYSIKQFYVFTLRQNTQSIEHSTDAVIQDQPDRCVCNWVELVDQKFVK